MKNNKFVGVLLGLLIIVSAFLAVFGKDLKNLSVNTTTSDSENTSSSAGDSATLKPGTQFSETGKDTKPTPKPVTKPITNPTTSSGEKSYSLADISSHNSATTCWSAINANVYDLTSWVDRHPGGRLAILMICGKDGSSLFNMQHGGQSRVGNILTTYKIASLK